jgi:hypothetical protein
MTADYCSDTPRSLAAAAEHSRVVEWLDGVERAGKAWPSLLIAAACRDCAAIKMLLRQGAGEPADFQVGALLAAATASPLGCAGGGHSSSSDGGGGGGPKQKALRLKADRDTAAAAASVGYASPGGGGGATTNTNAAVAERGGGGANCLQTTNTNAAGAELGGGGGAMMITAGVDTACARAVALIKMISHGWTYVCFCSGFGSAECLFSSFVLLSLLGGRCCFVLLSL